DLINRAYVYSVKVHGSQQRASGDPYFAHPIEVAGILTRYRLDTASIVTALLHDTVEDTATTIEEVEKGFGPEVAKLVDGVTKLSRIELQSREESQAENFRKFLLAMSADLRVLLVKLADRLHNMRTLKYLKSEDKRRRIARETLELYAPLAERIGMRDFQEELQDLAFAELNRDARDSIVRRLEFLAQRGGDVVPRILSSLEDLMKAEGIEAKISGRRKTPFSIWKKMQQKSVEFEQLSDIMAFRVVVKSVPDCYRALGAIHSKYRVVPGRFKDYISLPKPNGYRSLHTGVFGHGGHRIEVQIRTDEMHQFAEVGLAAHWQYKQNVAQADSEQYRWLRGLLDILEQGADAEEFLEHTKLEMFQDKVFCFTPHGDLIELPRGATPVDFAYAVHSEIGDHCVGAKLNGRMVPLRSTLKNGDQVEIITSKAQTPSPEWERFVVTGKARARVRRFVRLRQRQEYLDLGQAMLEKAFVQRGGTFTGKVVEPMLRQFGQSSVEDLVAAVGQGNVSVGDVARAVIPGAETVAAPAKAKKLPAKRAKKDGKDGAVQLKGLIPGMAVHFAGCCHPLPGERIVGIVTTGKGVTVHTIDCESLEAFADMPERWIDVAWPDEGDDNLHVGRLLVTVSNEPGALGAITTLIGKYDGNIQNLRFTTRSTDFFEMMIDIAVRDVRHLTNIMAALRGQKVVATVERARS
ncbi:MAG: bifunctional (p)ppGpp synthetase/guanosine-3',5'-bis(diphosphate) 3'-pyrophosphohydrolase, partial [Rhodospirillaceae bacterium]|nr:bifunctional (p)ppGpp synthetase/guanosine-3',5'-bis(diphosphate) 3'-pyrophosphohydrolase [Rhodospirillaceae bacterium]